MKTQTIRTKTFTRMMKIVVMNSVCSLLCLHVVSPEAPKSTFFGYSIKEEDANRPLAKLKALCDEIFWVPLNVIQENSDLKSKVEEIKKLIKSNKHKFFTDKGVDFAVLKDSANELTEKEVARLYELVVACDSLIREVGDEEPTVTEKISAVATQAKEKAVDIGQKIGRALKGGSQEVSKKAQEAAETVSEKAHKAKDTMKAQASRAGEKVKETGEKIKEKTGKQAANVKNKMRNVGEMSVAFRGELLKDIESLKGRMEGLLDELEKLEDKISC